MEELQDMYEQENEHIKRKVERKELEKSFDIILDLLDDMIDTDTGDILDDIGYEYQDLLAGRRIGLEDAKRVIKAQLRRVYND